MFSDEEIIKIQNILIIPNIEFRLDILVATVKNPSRINFHVLFSEEVPIIDIEEHFLHDIDFITEGNPQGPDVKRKLKLVNIEELGVKLKAEHEYFREDFDIVVGMKNALVNSSQICEILSSSKFKSIFSHYQQTKI